MIFSYIRQSLQAALDVVFPRHCISCSDSILSKRPFLFICESCASKIEFIQEPHCIRCGFPFYGHAMQTQSCPECTRLNPIFRQGRSVFRLKSTGKEIIHSFKYHQATYLKKDLQTLIQQYTPRIIDFLSDATLVPVPLHPLKEYTRGYNQSLLIAKIIQQLAPKTRLSLALKRIKRTQAQAFLSREARAKKCKKCLCHSQKNSYQSEHAICYNR